MNRNGLNTNFSVKDYKSNIKLGKKFVKQL